MVVLKAIKTTEICTKMHVSVTFYFKISVYVSTSKIT